MALPDYFKVEPGMAIVLGVTGGTAVTTVTHAIPLNGLGAGTAVVSDYIDFGSTWDEEYSVVAAMQAGTVAPTVITTWPLW